MNDEIKKYALDILNAIQYIESFIGRKRFATYQKDMKTKFAVERNLEIIGEAIGKILKIESTVRITSARQIVDFRNRLIHAYDMTDDYIVWQIVKNHIPVLKSEIESILNS